MTAPAIWAMNIDLGLLMVMCPVLKSCSRHAQGRHNNRCSKHSIRRTQAAQPPVQLTLQKRECNGRVQNAMSFLQGSTDQG